MQDATGAWLDHEAVSYSLATAYTPNMMMPTPTLSHPDIMLELERAETRSFSTIFCPYEFIFWWIQAHTSWRIDALRRVVRLPKIILGAC